MLSNIISYRGYHAEIRFDPSADAFHARVLGVRDVMSLLWPDAGRAAP